MRPKKAEIKHVMTFWTLMRLKMKFDEFLRTVRNFSDVIEGHVNPLE